MTNHGSQYMPKHSNYTRIKTCLLIIMFGIVSGPVAGVEKPLIEATFELVGKDIIISAQERKKLSRNIVSKLIEETDKSVGYFSWSPISESAQKADRWKTELKIWKTNYNESGQTSRGYTGTLKHFYSLDGADFTELLQPNNEDLIYPLGSRVPRSNAQTLEDDILCHFKTHLGRFLKTPVVAKFSSQIPILETVKIDEENKAVIIPVSLQHLQAESSGTKLKVSFRDATLNKNAHIELDQLTSEGDDLLPGEIAGRVISYVVPRTDITLDLGKGKWWDAKFKDIGPPSKVYMKTYSPCVERTCSDSAGAAQNPEPDIQTEQQQEPELKCTGVNS